MELYSCFMKIWALLVAVNFGETHSERCNYIMPKLSEISTGVVSDPLPLRVKRGSSSNLRIQFYYMPDFLQNPQSQTIINQFLIPAQTQLQQALTVLKPITGVLTVNQNCLGDGTRAVNGIVGCASGCVAATTCLNITVPSIFLKQCVVVDTSGNVNYTGTTGAGATNADIVLLITNQPCTGGRLAYAASCFMDTNDRPILGVVNLCNGTIQPNVNVKVSIRLIKHEIVHALGFATDKFAFYRYPNGTPIVPRDGLGYPNIGLSSDNSYYMWNDAIIKTFTRNRASVSSTYTVSFLGFVLPNVLQVARNQFNCPTLDGVDLEDFGGTGSAMTHFDEYVYYNEIMTAQTNMDLDSFSNLTLALLKDTGWYDVDYTTAEYYYYGRGKGCVLPLQGCYTYMKTQSASGGSLDPFCNVPYTYGQVLTCSSRLDNYQFCSLSNVPGLPSQYQYFTAILGIPAINANSFGGPSQFAEYCPAAEVYSNPSTICSDTNNSNLTTNNNIIPSYFGNDSLCVTNGVIDTNTNYVYGASCQKYTATSATTGILFFGSQSFPCPSNTSYSVVYGGKTILLNCPIFSNGTNYGSQQSSSTNMTLSAQSRGAEQLGNCFWHEYFILGMFYVVLRTCVM